MAAALNKRVLLLLLLRRRQQRRGKQEKYKKRFWIRKIFQQRQTKSEYHLLIKELQLYDHEYFFKQFRMLPSKFEELLSFVAPFIAKSSLRRDAVSLEERLCITLRYLVTGDAKTTIASSYRVSPTTAGRIVSETCATIWAILMEKGFLKVPTTHHEWKDVAYLFENDWNFPNCVGAIDGKHVVIQAPARAGSSFYNYKGTHSIVLMAVCDARYKFLLVDIGDSGRESDGSVFASCNLGQAIHENKLNLPDARELDGTHVTFPYVFVGDEAFPLKTSLIKPYPRNALDDKKRIFNYRISRARRVIENTFGICASRFRIFRRPIISTVENVVLATKAVVALHNYLMADHKFYFPPLFADSSRGGKFRPGDWRKEVSSLDGLADIPRIGSNNYTNDAKDVRENFCNYFSSAAGAVPWQFQAVNNTLDDFDRELLA